MNKVIYIFIAIVSFHLSSYAQADLEVERKGIMEKTLTVGINTYSTNSELFLNDFDADGSCIMMLDDGIRTGIIGIDNAQEGITGTTSAHDLQFFSGSTTRIHIESTGEMGLGTTAPGAAFHVSEPGTSGVPTEVAIIESAASNRPVLLFSETGIGAGNTMGILYNGAGSGATEKLQVINDAGTPIVTWTNNELMGIGSTSPRAQLDVIGNVAISSVPGSLILDNGAVDSELTFDGTDLIMSANGGNAKILANRRVILQSLGDDIILDAADDIQFQIDHVIKMNCIQSGNWGLNKNTPTARFHVKQNTTNLPAVLIENDGDTDTWDWEISTEILKMSYNNIVKSEYFTTGTYITSSDRRLKEEITHLKDGVLASVLQLKPSRYFYNRDLKSEHRTIGFIAQEMQVQFPELVIENDKEDSDFLGINYAGISVVAVKAIQEQNEEIINLINEIKNQKVSQEDIDQSSAALENLEKRITALQQ